MNNLHISLTEFRNESRVLKQTRSILEHGIADNIYIAALHGDDLQKLQNISNGINLNRFKMLTRKLPKYFLVQVLKYFEFLIRLAFHYRKKNIGMVNIHSLALLPLGVMLKYRYSAKLIYDAHELETETNGLHGIRKKLAKRVECSLIRFADQVFVVGEAIADQYMNDYNIDRPIVLLNAPKYKKTAPSNRFREKFFIAEDMTIFLYQGGLAAGRGVEVLIDAFKSTQSSKAVVVFMGYGPLEVKIKAASAEFSNIFFHPAVPSDVVLDYTVSADVGISLIENTCLSYYYCMPNKLFEYIMVGLPVIVSNMQEMATFVNDNNLGVVAMDETPEAIIKAIKKLLALDLVVLRKNALETSKGYSWDLQEKKMISAYKNLLGEVVA